MDKIKNSKIILDSCILIYSCDSDTKTSCLELLNKLLSNGNQISCSAFSGFEVIKNRQEDENEKEYTDFLNQTYSIPIDSPVLMNSATLYYLYKKSGRINYKQEAESEMIDPKDKLTGDLIIGGTVISYQNHVLLTANKKDFPAPYWKTTAKHTLTTTKNKEILLYLIEPIMDEIVEALGSMPKKPETWPSRQNNYEYRG